MTDEQQPKGRLTGFLARHRRGLITAVVVVALYTLLGFFLAPWLIHDQAVKAVRAQLGSELRIEKVALNPYALSLRIDGLEFDDPAGEPLARIGQIYINFQTSSLFRWAWTFRDFRIEQPELHVSRNDAGSFNFQRVLEQMPEPVRDTGTRDEEPGMPRLIVHQFVIDRASLRWSDSLPVEPVSHIFGPINVSVLDLNTLPGRVGRQSVVINTATEGAFAWGGSLQLNPLESAGQASLTGSHFGLLSDYLRHETGLDIVRGDADLQFDYSVTTESDASISAIVGDLTLDLNDVLVKTFPAGLRQPDAPERELLSLPSLRLAGGRLQWPEQAVGIEALDVDGATISLYRDDAGVFDVVRAFSEGEETVPAQPAEGPAEAADSGKPWRITLDRLGIEEVSVSMEDHSVDPTAEIGVETLNLEMTGISNEPGTVFPTRLSWQGLRGGTVTLDGELTVLPRPVADFELTIDGLVLAAAHPYLRPLADVSLDSGALNLNGRLRSNGDNPFFLAADAEIVDFLITETEEGTRLGSWERAAAEKLVVNVAENKVEVSQLRFERPYGDIVITEEGRVNLGRIAPGDAGASGDESGERHEEESPEPATDEDSVAVTIGRVVIADASADFADRSLPLPFSASIAELSGELSTIATTSAEPSRVSLEGKVDQYGFVSIAGTVTPLDPAENTDIEVAFENVDMPKFSAYSVPFAGRKIASGRLDLDLGYQVQDGRLVGRNDILLREFELGEEVPHPDAMSLPLGLAVALLKDREGNIDVDLPVSGDVGDPEFSIGGVVMKALGNLIVKIATSPFALLGKLVGIEPAELEYVNFLPGRSDLTPPEQETAAKLAEALALRPELLLRLPPAYAPAADAAALRKSRLQAMVDERLEAGATDATDDTYTARRREVLEALYREQATAADPAAALGAMQATHTAAVEGEDDQEQTAEPRLDEPAYLAALEDELASLQTVTTADLEALAVERAGNVRDAIVGADESLAGRLRLTEVTEVEPEDGDIRMKVELTAGGGDSAPAASSASGS